MKKRFVIGINSITEEQEEKLRNYIRNSTKYGWWHWFKNFWLIVDYSGRLTPSTLRDEILNIIPNTRILVIEVKDKYTWAGYGPVGPPVDMFEWINKYWDTD